MKSKKLHFRDRKFPIKIIKRVLALLVIYIISLVGFEFLTNFSVDKSRVEDSTVSLPIVKVTYLEDVSTSLHGYVRPMNISFMRDALIPLSKNREISIDIDINDFNLDKLEYEVRSLDAERKLSGTEITDYEVADHHILANLQIENLIDAGEEYQLIFILRSGENAAYYYTRIIFAEDGYEKECVDFARNFHNKALAKDYSSIERYLEPSQDADKNSLYAVTINSTPEQVAYGGFDGVVQGDVDITITDSTAIHTAITMDYVMTRDVGHIEYYMVHEYYRIRYTKDRTYLLDYSRNMEQRLDFDNISFEENLVNVGMANPDVHYLSNETGTIIAFVSAGELFIYNQNERRLNRVFSFIADEPEDRRRTLNEHAITILNIDEAGTMDYVVYGYMNAGDHEGECGINLFHYDSVSKKSIEQIFIESTDSYEILKANFSQLLYETSENIFFIMVRGTLVRINLTDMSYTEIMTGLKDSMYCVSASGRYLAYIDTEDVASVIHVLDLEFYSSFDIMSAADSMLKPLTFMDDDLAYGIVDKKTIINDGAGTTVYPVNKVNISRIIDGKENVLMSYSKPGYYVSGCRLKSYTLFLDRITIDDGIIYPANGDTIKNSAGEQNRAVPIELKKSESKGQEVILTLAKLPSKETLGNVTMKASEITVGATTRSISVTTVSGQEQYYVYLGNKVAMATNNLTKAIAEADASMGVVIDSKQQYIWKRGKKAYVNSFTNVVTGTGDTNATCIAKALSAMIVREGENVQVHTLLEYGETPISVIDKALKDVTSLDLTGATLDQVLYYLNVGNPVLAITGDNEAVVIVGYEASSIIVYDPKIGGRRRIPIQEARDWFDSTGNIFVSYVK